jgi:tRNA A-37 threonylcarbamoyl transferase component Bud32
MSMRKRLQRTLMQQRQKVEARLVGEVQRQGLPRPPVAGLSPMHLVAVER